MECVNIDIEQEVVECPICYDPIEIMFTLPCKHVFCKDCLNKYFLRLCRDNQTINCPFCRHEVLLNTSVDFIAIRDVLMQQTSNNSLQSTQQPDAEQSLQITSNNFNRSLLLILIFVLVVAFAILLAVVVENI